MSHATDSRDCLPMPRPDPTRPDIKPSAICCRQPMGNYIASLGNNPRKTPYCPGLATILGKHSYLERDIYTFPGTIRITNSIILVRRHTVGSRLTYARDCLPVRPDIHIIPGKHADLERDVYRCDASFKAIKHPHYKL